MKNKAFTILLILAGMAAILYYLKQGSRPDRQDFHIENIDDIASISISDKKPSSVLVERQDDGTWLVDKSFEARQASIDILLETLRRMRVKSAVATSAQANVFKNLASQGKKVSVAMKDGSTKTFYVGKEAQNHLGTYMMIEGAEKPYLMHIPGFNGFLSSRFFTGDYNWKSHKIVAWDNLDVHKINIEYPSALESSFELEITEDGDMLLKDVNGQIQYGLDSLKVQMYLANYRKVYYEGLVSEGDQIDQIGIMAKGPLFIMNLENFEGEKVKVEGFARPNYKEVRDEAGELYPNDIERLFGLLNDQDFVLMQYLTFDKLLVQKSHFVVNNS